MKLLLIILTLTSFSTNISAKVIEGRLVSKLHGELDAFVLGDGCISIIEYFDFNIKNLTTIGIFESTENGCLSTDVDENDEIDFNPSELTLIVDRAEIEAITSLAQDMLGIDGSINLYKVQSN